MDHIASFIAFVLSVILTFTALITMLIIHERDVKRHKSMRNHPAGKAFK